MRRIRHEKRASQRYPVDWRLEGRAIAFHGFLEHREEILRGQVQNLGQGGLCLLVETPIQKSSVLRCEIFPDGVQAGIPTIVEVRWMARNSGQPGTKVGLRFLT